MHEASLHVQSRTSVDAKRREPFRIVEVRIDDFSKVIYTMKQMKGIESKKN